MSNLSVFLSYSIKDRVLAGDYKKHLEIYYGFKVFVSHDDLVPSVEWNPSIIREISASNIFLLLVSQNSISSSFVNQEIGMALASSLTIFPIRTDKSIPPGFIEKIQGFAPHKNEVDGVLANGSKLFSVLTTSESCSKYADIAVESSILALGKSTSFKNSVIIIRTLLEVEKIREFTKDQINQLTLACLKNNQVYWEGYEYPSLKKLLEDKYEVTGLK